MVRATSNTQSMLKSFLILGVFSKSTMGTVPKFPPVHKLPRSTELPDPLVMFDGTTRIVSADGWTALRRHELKQLFHHYMYGQIPAVPSKVEFQIDHCDNSAFNGKATIYQLNVVPLPGQEFSFRVLVAIPNAPIGKKFGCFVGMNFCGNHCLIDDPNISIPTCWIYDKWAGVVDNKATESGRGKHADRWNIEQTIDRGYAVATFHNCEIEPDRADIRDGIRPFLPNDIETTTIACWAWSIHRTIDVLEQLAFIDPRKLIAVGHSRLGKTALLAAAMDERIALAIPHQAGCGGTAPSRGTVGESVKQINDVFPHWFNNNFKLFNDDPCKLPFDQHSLVSLCAPRPVLFSNAIEDEWANPNGQFEVLQAADPVYRLLDAGGLDTKTIPVLGELSKGTLGYFIRSGKHSMDKTDWQAFLDFADAHLG
jgi:hypothetical protein